MPAQLRFRPGAVGQLFHEGQLVKEVHSSTCSHCQKMTEFESRRTMMEHVDFCRGCMRLICLDCYGKPCVPFERRAERMEELARLRSRIHMQAWRCY